MNHQWRFRCQIDFKNTAAVSGNDDIMFHTSIRPRDGVIVRNHFQYGRWGMEERYGPCQVRKNQTFEIVILAELQYYKIAVNGHHLGVFRHRLPLHLVQFIHVSGDVTVDHILLEQDARSAQQQIVVSQVVNPSYYQSAQPLYQTHVVHQHQQPPPSYFDTNTVRSFANVFNVRFSFCHSRPSPESAQFLLKAPEEFDLGLRSLSNKIITPTAFSGFKIPQIFMQNYQKWFSIKTLFWSWQISRNYFFFLCCLIESRIKLIRFMISPAIRLWISQKLDRLIHEFIHQRI